MSQLAGPVWDRRAVNVRDESPEHADSLANFGFAVSERPKRLLPRIGLGEKSRNVWHIVRAIFITNKRPGTSLTALVPGLFGFCFRLSAIADEKQNSTDRN